MQKLLIILCLLFFSITAHAQITVRGEHQTLPVRGAIAIITVPGIHLETNQAGSLDNFPLELAGIHVLIEGLPCPIRGYSQDRIAFLVPESLPLISDWRRRAYTVTVVTPFGRSEGETLIARVLPGLVGAGGGAAAVGLWYRLDGFNVLAEWAPIPVDSERDTWVVVWGSGVRFAFGRPPVRVRIQCDDFIEIVGGTARPVAGIDGLDGVKFKLPKSMAGAGMCQVSVIAGGQESQPKTIQVK